MRALRAAVPLVCLLLVAACGAGASPKASKPADEVSRVSVGGDPVGIAASAAGDLWVALPGEDEVAGIRAGRPDPAAQVPVRSTPLRLTLAEHDAALWVTAFRDGAVVRVDTATKKVTDRVPVGAGAEGVTEAFGSIWVAVQDDGLLVQVDPTRRAVVRKVAVGAGVRLVVPGPDALWLDDHATGTVVRVDPRSYQVRRSDRLCDGPEDIAVAAGSVWVTCSQSNELVALDPGDLHVQRRVSLTGTPDAVTVAPDGSLLVVLQAGPTLVRLDAASGKETSRTRLGTLPQLHDQANLDVAVTGDDAWVTSYGNGRVLRTSWRG